MGYARVRQRRHGLHSDVPKSHRLSPSISPGVTALGSALGFHRQGAYRRRGPLGSSGFHRHGHIIVTDVTRTSRTHMRRHAAHKDVTVVMWDVMGCSNFVGTCSTFENETGTPFYDEYGHGPPSFMSKCSNVPLISIKVIFKKLDLLRS